MSHAGLASAGDSGHCADARFFYLGSRAPADTLMLRGAPVVHPPLVERAKLLFVRHFERMFVVSLVFFYQYVQGLDMLPGFYPGALLSLVPWAGFLILTGYVVGRLAEQRELQLTDVKNAYLATLELLAYHLESTERHQQGHSNRVAELAVAIGRELHLSEADLENLRVAALLHEVGPRDQRLVRLLSRSVTDSTVAVARVMRGAAQLIAEYGHYYEIVGEDWDIEALSLPVTVKVLAVADAFETLQMATPVRPAFPKWSALEEVEKGAGKTFATAAVRALRSVAGRPEAASASPVRELKVV